MLPTITVSSALTSQVIPISAGEGNQCVFWLAINAVQRYLLDHNSYSRRFSEELTPKGVLTSDLEWLDNHSTIRNELADGDHVWVDVGDGIPISEVQSRASIVRVFKQEHDGVEQDIAWDVDEEDKRRVMRYSRTERKQRMTFDMWRSESMFTFLQDNSDLDAAELDTADDGTALYATFTNVWKSINLGDLPVRLLPCLNGRAIWYVGSW